MSYPVVGRWIEMVKTAAMSGDANDGTATLNQMRAYFGKPEHVIKAFSAEPETVQAFVNNWAQSPEVAGATFN